MSLKRKRRKHCDGVTAASSPVNHADASSREKKDKKKEKRKKRKKECGPSSEAHHRKAQDSAAPSPTSATDTRRSPYQVKTILGTVALLPSSTSDVIKHIQSLLHSLLLTYDSKMGGVLLSLQGESNGEKGSSVKLLPATNKMGSSLIGGRIINDLPHVHYRFQAVGLLFCPMIGTKLRGQVVECTPTYVTLTTHHILSTKISAETLQESGFVYDSKTLEWTGDRERKGSDSATAEVSVYLDSTLEFVVARIHECGGYISLDGSCPSVVPSLGRKKC